MIGLTLLALTLGANPGENALDGAPDARGRLARLIEVSAIDDACSFLRAEERSTLDRAIRSARRDAGREGLDGASAEASTERARRRWMAASCNDPEVHGQVSRYRQAMHAWLADGEALFEGHTRHWTAQRVDGQTTHWTLAQDAQRGAVSARFGSVLIGGEPVVLLAVRAPQAPVTAILSLRDETRAPRAIDLTAGGMLPPPGGDVLAGLGAPSSAHKRIWATGRLRDGDRFAIPGEGEYTAFTFPASVLDALTALDSAEGARLELYDGSGVRIGLVWIEIGTLPAAIDYAAAANGWR